MEGNINKLESLIIPQNHHICCSTFCRACDSVQEKIHGRLYGKLLCDRLCDFLH